jgi:predicted PurR-regulated permease PerM
VRFAGVKGCDEMPRQNSNGRPPQARRPIAYRSTARPRRVQAGATPEHDDAVRYGLRVAAGYAWRLIVIGIAVFFVFVALGRIQLVVGGVFVALLITALLRPLADRLARHLPRGLAVAIALIQAIIVVGGLLLLVASSAIGQFSTLARQFGSGLADIDRALSGPPLNLPTGELPRLIAQGTAWLTTNQGAVADRALGGVGTIAELFAGFTLAVFCSIFFLHSGDRMWAWFVDQMPHDRPRWNRAAGAAWMAFAGYARGIVIVAGTNAVLVCAVLLLLRVPLAFPLALLVLIAGFIPLIGAPIALTVATVVALAGRGPIAAAVILALIVIIGQFEGHVLQPLVMSRAVNLHPVVVAVSVASGTLLAGIMGAVIAVPLVAVTWAAFTQLRRQAAVPAPREPSWPDPTRALPS